MSLARNGCNLQSEQQLSTSSASPPLPANVAKRLRPCDARNLSRRFYIYPIKRMVGVSSSVLIGDFPQTSFFISLKCSVHAMRAGRSQEPGGSCGVRNVVRAGCASTASKIIRPHPPDTMPDTMPDCGHAQQGQLSPTYTQSPHPKGSCFF